MNENQICDDESCQICDEDMDSSRNFSFCEQLFGVNYEDDVFNNELASNVSEGLFNQENPWKLDLNVLKNIHATERFKLESEKGKSKILGIADLNWDTLMDLESRESYWRIVSKMPRKEDKIKKFVGRKIEQKRSIAYADNIVRGLALYELRIAQNAELLKCRDEARKTIFNHFTNYSRKDRGTGLKLEKEFIETHKGLSKFSTYDEIISYFTNLTIFVFDHEGYLAFVSPHLLKECVFFYEGKDDFFIINNIKGFCRIAN